MGADLRLYEIASGVDRAIPICLASDFDHLRERWTKNPHDYTTSVHLSPDGSSVVLTSRGRAFVAPLKGRFVDVSAHKPGRYREAWFLPDGKNLLLLSTESGEVEFWKEGRRQRHGRRRTAYQRWQRAPLGGRPVLSRLLRAIIPTYLGRRGKTSLLAGP